VGPDRKPAIGASAPCFVGGCGDQSRFSDMNREGSLGADNLLQLIGADEDNDRGSLIKNEHPRDAGDNLSPVSW
jgi:hypothetical protein